MSEKPPWYLELSRYNRKEQIDEAIGKLRAEVSIVRGIGGGLGTGALGMLVWKIFACFGPLAFGLFPLVLGLGVGSGVRIFGKGDRIAFSIVGLIWYTGAVLVVIGVLGVDCGFSISGFDPTRFGSLDEVGFLSLIGGAIIVWALSRRSIDGDLVLSELKKLDT